MLKKLKRAIKAAEVASAKHAEAAKFDAAAWAAVYANSEPSAAAHAAAYAAWRRCWHRPRVISTAGDSWTAADAVRVTNEEAREKVRKILQKMIAKY